MILKVMEILEFISSFRKNKNNASKTSSPYEEETEQTESMIPKRLLKRKYLYHHHPYKKSFLRIGE